VLWDRIPIDGLYLSNFNSIVYLNFGNKIQTSTL